MACEAVHVGVDTRPSEYLGVVGGYRTATLALQRSGDNRRSAASHSGADLGVYKLDDIVCETHSNLPTHPNMVALRDAYCDW